jgi:hypothetical protein
LYLQKTIADKEEIIKILFKIQYQDKTQYNLHKANQFQLIYPKIKKVKISKNKKNKTKKRNPSKKKTMIIFLT